MTLTVQKSFDSAPDLHQPYLYSLSVGAKGSSHGLQRLFEDESGFPDQSLDVLRSGLDLSSGLSHALLKQTQNTSTEVLPAEEGTC